MRDYYFDPREEPFSLLTNVGRLILTILTEDLFVVLQPTDIYSKTDTVGDCSKGVYSLQPTDIYSKTDTLNRLFQS